MGLYHLSRGLFRNGKNRSRTVNAVIFSVVKRYGFGLVRVPLAWSAPGIPDLSPQYVRVHRLCVA